MFTTFYPCLNMEEETSTERQRLFSGDLPIVQLHMNWNISTLKFSYDQIMANLP